MIKTKLLILSLIIIFIIISILVIININFNIYDKNGYLNFIEYKINNILKKQSFKEYEKEKIIKINIEEKITSNKFMHLLFALKETDPKLILINMNSDFLKDDENIDIIYDWIKNEKIVLGIIPINNYNKSILFTDYNINKNNIKSCIDIKNIKNKYQFMGCYFLYELKLNPNINIPENKIGFVINQDNLIDANNIDLLLRFKDKYIISLPLMNILNNNIETDKLKFDYLKLNYDNKVLYIDQKARSGFLHNINNNIIEKDKNATIYNFKEWDKNLDLRFKAIDNLTDLKIFLKNDNKGYELYLKENEIINNIYGYPDLNNTEENNILNETKNLLTIWKSYSKTNIENYNNNIVIIDSSKDVKWINNYYYQKKILENGINLKRIPLELTLIFALLIFLLIFTFSIKSKILKIIPVIISILLTIISFILYFFLRLYFKIDFPFNSIIFTNLYSLITGLFLKIIIVKIWTLKFSLIFKNNISKNKITELLKIYKSKKWSPDLKEYIATFVNINLQEIVKKDMTENDVFTISKLINKLEKIIKDNNGYIVDNNTAGLTCVFGIPFVSNQHSKESINAADELSREILSLYQDYYFSISIHTKKEWFKLVKNGSDLNYKFIGNSLIFLNSISKYAKKFNIKLIITDLVYKTSKSNLPVRMLDRIKIHGINKSIRLFELYDAEKFQFKNDFINYFHAGLKLFENKKWNEASKYFQQCLKSDQNDIPSKIYLERCREFSYVEPNDEWDCTFEID